MKEQVYAMERAFFSPNAFFSENTAGRMYPLNECPLRTEFQRDRDRIIHSKSFRRLMHKMQVFLAPEGDHYRTRLTHTLEVAQIGRTIARGMRLNEDLTEAISLGHDLGHTPFGHSGERALNAVCPFGFSHSEQSIRVCDVLENLNLTCEVRDGILKHTKGGAYTKEGQIVYYADHIAYINHDIDDAIRAGIIKTQDIPQKANEVLGTTHGERIATMVNAVINHGSDGDIGMDEPYSTVMHDLHEFMFEKVYRSPVAKSEDPKVYTMISSLYSYFLENIDKLPEEYTKNLEKDGKERVVCDHLAGMTDRYAISVYENIFVPKVWQYK